METIKHLAKGSAEYKKAYNRGWKASENYTDGALERADGRGETHAWYDGDHDSAAGRKKWHFLRCDDHDFNCIGWNA